MKIEELKRHLDAGKPVICGVQMYGSAKEISESAAGHYVTVIGYQGDSVIFQDPAREGDGRTRMPASEFESIWRITGKTGGVMEGFGVAVGPKQQPVVEAKLPPTLLEVRLPPERQLATTKIELVGKSALLLRRIVRGQS